MPCFCGATSLCSHCVSIKSAQRSSIRKPVFNARQEKDGEDGGTSSRLETFSDVEDASDEFTLHGRSPTHTAYTDDPWSVVAEAAEEFLHLADKWARYVQTVEKLPERRILLNRGTGLQSFSAITLDGTRCLCLSLMV